MFSTIPGNTLITKPIEDGKTDIATFIWLKKVNGTPTHRRLGQTVLGRATNI
jgi:hypothetical protein